MKSLIRCFIPHVRFKYLILYIFFYLCQSFQQGFPANKFVIRDSRIKYIDAILLVTNRAGHQPC
jgi:hypothetical protein